MGCVCGCVYENGYQRGYHVAVSDKYPLPDEDCAQDVIDAAAGGRHVRVYASGGKWQLAGSADEASILARDRGVTIYLAKVA